MAVEIITSFEQQTDSSGDPISGCKIYVYDVGTTSLQTLYPNTDLTGTAANPIICDSAGRHDMRYKATGSYKIVVKTSADVTVYTRDNIDGRIPLGSTGILAVANGGTGSGTAAGARTNLDVASASELADLASDVADVTPGVEKTHISTGTTAQRPTVPVAGDIRRNTTTGYYEGYSILGSATWESFATFANGLATFTAMTIQNLTSGTTYTTPTGCKWIRVRAVGGGGGGGGTAGSPTAGGTTSFNSVTAVGGSAGANVTGGGGAGGAGGTGGTGTAAWRQNGASGGPGGAVAGGSSDAGVGGISGGTPFSSGSGRAVAGATNSGAGGGGAQGTGAGGSGAGGGGGGEYFELMIAIPSATYTYAIGAAGTAGTGAGAGAAGRIIVEEYYV
jgi:hypothetical protein